MHGQLKHTGCGIIDVSKLLDWYATTHNLSFKQCIETTEDNLLGTGKKEWGEGSPDFWLCCGGGLSVFKL